MKTNLFGFALVAVALVAAAFVFGGRYSTMSAPSGSGAGVYVVDRFSGEVWNCDATGCVSIKRY